MYFLMHLYLNMNFDWHFSDNDGFIVFNNKEVKYKIFKSADENLHFSVHSREFSVLGQYFLVITQNVNTIKYLDLMQASNILWEVLLVLCFSSLFLHVLILLLSNWHLIFLALKMSVVRVVECNMWYFNIVTLNAT